MKRILRKLFSSWIIEKNRKSCLENSPIFTSIINPKYSQSAQSFTDWIASLLPQLQNWKDILDSGVMPIVTHFVWDEGKEVNTGHYIQTMCQARVIDENSGIITLDDKTEICIDDILVIEGISA